MLLKPQGRCRFVCWFGVGREVLVRVVVLKSNSFDGWVTAGEFWGWSRVRMRGPAKRGGRGFFCG